MFRYYVLDNERELMYDHKEKDQFS